MYTKVTEHTPNRETSYTYDDNGNLVKQSGETSIDYSYDKENHLLRATIQKGNSVTVEAYTYDYAGNRTSKTINESNTTYYVSDTSATLTMVVAETNEAGEEIASYTRGEELLSMEKGGQICYYLYDGHGSVRALTNEAGEVTDQYSYDAYGNLLEKEGSTENEFLYTGEQYNANTGLYYLRARYMNPSTGTFISMDSYQGSIYEPVTLHKYLYANANPVMYTDPSGYSAVEGKLETALVCGTIAGILASSYAYRQGVALKMYTAFRKSLKESVIVQTVCFTKEEWKNYIIDFPAHIPEQKVYITFPTVVIIFRLFEAIYATEYDDSIPGFPGVVVDDVIITWFPEAEQSGTKIYSDYIADNRVPMDNEIILGSGTFQKTKIRVKGATVYKKGNKYYYRDTFHTGESAHLEVFDKFGNHLGEADPKTGELKPGTADSSKKIKIK